MKLNWGHKIAAVYTIFAVFIIGMVVRSASLNTELVTKNYYEAEINYQDRIDQINNSKSLKEQVKISYAPTKQNISIDFPDLDSEITGQAILLRPSNASMDRSIELALAANQDFNYSTQTLTKGLWRLEVQWEADRKAYYNEQVIVIQ